MVMCCWWPMPNLSNFIFIYWVIRFGIDVYICTVLCYSRLYFGILSSTMKFDVGASLLYCTYYDLVFKFVCSSGCSDYAMYFLILLSIIIILTILIAGIADKKLLFTGRWQFWSLIKVLKSLLMIKIIIDREIDLEKHVLCFPCKSNEFVFCNIYFSCVTWISWILFMPTTARVISLFVSGIPSWRHVWVLFQKFPTKKKLLVGYWRIGHRDSIIFYQFFVFMILSTLLVLLLMSVTLTLALW
jgi:hypothetical protein